MAAEFTTDGFDADVLSSDSIVMVDFYSES